MKPLHKTKIATLISLSLLASAGAVSGQAIAEETAAKESKLEVIEVTARKRVENAQEVPVSVSALQGENLDAYASAGMDIRFMNAKIPSLSVESSFGRTFPRFYVRGLGNTDFDLNASQPVSLVVDDVVQENPILKGFPVFDIERIEVLRGPQGTLFGRNTPAGLVKFDSVKPSQVFDGYATVSYGTGGAVDFEGAVGGGLTERVSARVAGLWQEKDDYIDNLAPGFEQPDVLGGYSEKAARVQFLYEGDDFTGLLAYRVRDLDGKPIVFHANLMNVGSNKIRPDWDDKVVFQDAASRATQQVQTQGVSLRLEWDLGDYDLLSITAWDSAEIYSRADVDGGYGAAFLPDYMGPGVILFPAESADGIPDHDQFTQEIRLASNFTGPWNYQTGLYYFQEDLTIDSFSFDTLAGGIQNGYAFQNQKTKAWAVFGAVDYDVNDRFAISAGLRYSKDDKDFYAERVQGPFGSGTAVGTANPDDDHISWDLSGVYQLTDEVNLFARLANGFRAPSIQGRILFGNEVTVADSETINSAEMGIKSDVLDGNGRVNLTAFYYEMKDQQLTAVGGESNFNRLLNADKTVGYGLELDSTWILASELMATFNASYNKTKLEDGSLYLPGCAQCTVTDPFVAGKGYSIDGNNLPHAPEWIANLTLEYSRDLGEGEFYVFTDWSYRSEIDFFLYQSIEFTGEALLEGGLRTGYKWDVGDFQYEVAAFARNLLDERVVIGGVDFNNNTGMVNQGRFVGVEVRVDFF
ncbi:TonB-dependent receptor [Shewanella sp. GXUN23E]|uniref:TonB-dependent receptor n=1 Tax=Shewanella sp. GXUN23E TaxID=3422498 RepID=UPI003D7DA09D